MKVIHVDLDSEVFGCSEVRIYVTNGEQRNQLLIFSFGFFEHAYDLDHALLHDWPKDMYVYKLVIAHSARDKIAYNPEWEGLLEKINEEVKANVSTKRPTTSNPDPCRPYDGSVQTFPPRNR